VKPSQPPVAAAAQGLRNEFGLYTDLHALVVDGRFDDVSQRLGELFDAATRQGTRYPGAAELVPLLAGLATDERLADIDRAWVMLDLFLFASFERRHSEDTDDSGGREAVAATLPALAGRWDTEPEVCQFLLAGIAAAFPQAGGRLSAAMARMAESHPGTGREAVMHLMLGLTRGDDAAITSALRETEVWYPEIAQRHEGHYGSVVQHGLCVLEDLLEAELDAVR